MPARDIILYTVHGYIFPLRLRHFVYTDVQNKFIHKYIYIKELFEKISHFAGVKAPTLKLPDTVLHGLGIIGDALNSIGVPFGLSRENAFTATLFHWFNCQKAKTELNFNPKPADYAIENSVRWMKDNHYIS